MNVNTNIEQLEERAAEIDVKAERKFAKEISDALTFTLARSDMVAIAAPQIGYAYRAIAVKFDSANKNKNDIRVFFNPMIEADHGFTLARQSDPSLPGRTFIHPRSTKISLAYQNIDGKAFTSEYQGTAAATIQQKIDLLDGILLEEIGLEIDDLFDKATEEEKSELIQAYTTALGKRHEIIQKEIAEDPNLKEIDSAIKFMQSVQSGETKIVSDLKVEVSE